MDVTFRIFCSLTCGAIAGAVLGLGLGLAWVNLVQTANFEGYTSMLVMFGFMPIGALIGSVVGGCSIGMHLIKHQRLPDANHEDAL